MEIKKKKKTSFTFGSSNVRCVIGGTRGSENKQIESQLTWAVRSRGSKRNGLKFLYPRSSMNVWYILPTFGPPKTTPVL